jgi:hypothetical protein
VRRVFSPSPSSLPSFPPVNRSGEEEKVVMVASSPGGKKKIAMVEAPQPVNDFLRWGGRARGGGEGWEGRKEEREGRRQSEGIKRHRLCGER